MPVTFSIKNVPDAVAQALRERAERNRRSLQGELLAVVEEAVRSRPELTLREIHERARARAIGSKRDESAGIVRRMREARTAQLERAMKGSRGRR